MRDFLLRMRERIEAGWIQHILYAPDGRCCLYGALLIADEREDENNPSHVGREVDYLLNALLLKRGFSKGYIHYNDTIGRTKEEILQLLDEAIQSCDNKS